MSKRKITLTSYYNRAPLEMTADCLVDHPARRAWVEVLKQLGFKPRLFDGRRAEWAYGVRFDDERLDFEFVFDRTEKIAILAGELFFGEDFQHVFQA